MISEYQEFESHEKQNVQKLSKPNEVAILDRHSGQRSKIKSSLRESKSQNLK